MSRHLGGGRTFHHAMNDLIYLGLTVACFILCGLYARGCETL
ncbi:hypothetical protein [Prosthecobacter sp.]